MQDQMMGTVFTPELSLIGSILIEVTSILLMAFFDRIMGTTGILAGRITPSGGPIGHGVLLFFRG